MAKPAKKKLSQASSIIEERLYEALVLCKPLMDLDSVEATVSNLEKNIMGGLDAKIVKMDKLGRKRLAYEIKGFRDAFVVLVYFNMTTNNVKEFRRLVQIQEDILRMTVTRTSEALMNRSQQQQERPGFNRDNRDGNREGSGPRGPQGGPPQPQEEPAA
jgi:small subunit ribosomal protein S6